MGITIATHNGSQVHQAHNIRDSRVVNKERHINPNGSHEVWCHTDIRTAYERIFGEAVKDYNERQKRDDRKIKSYYDKIKNSAKQHTAYEMIIGVYGNDDKKENKKIMQEYIEGWAERNPNLRMIGAYYHDDEQGEAHCHIDYIPVATGYTTGMRTRTGLNKALEQQGIIKQPHTTPQIMWEKKENKALADICNEHGLDITNKRTKRKHLDKQEYIKKQEIEKLEARFRQDKNIKEHIEVAQFIKHNEPQLYDDIVDGFEAPEIDGITRNKTIDITH